MDAASRQSRTLLAVSALAILGACGGGAGGGPEVPDEVTFVVRNAAGQPVAGAVVWLVPGAMVDGAAIDAQDVLDGTAAQRDEPVEDVVRNAGAGLAHGTTGAGGEVTLQGLAQGRYFWFVDPQDGEHLPGGSESRRSRQSFTFFGTTVDVQVSSRPSAGAAYVGSSACLSCHPSYGQASQHAHALSLAVPGSFGALQDPARYPSFTGLWNLFLPGATFTAGTPVWLSDFDPTRGDDKFRASLSDPSGGGAVVYLRAWLWRDTGDADRFKVTLENLINPADPGSPRTLEVALTYGGAIATQRLLVRVPGRNGRYPLLQWQIEGDETVFDRTRKVFRDYRLDTFWNDAAQMLVDPPPGGAFEGNCTGCHSTGFERFLDAGTGEWLSAAAPDPAGIFDIDGNGSPDEINVGCEVCHGPGSEHAAWAANPANAGAESRFIVQPGLLSAERATMLCGRCHDQPLGNGPVVTGEPLDPAGRMPPPGIGRHDFLAQHTTRAGPTLADFWSDGVHSRSRQQHYADHVKSRMHRNDRILTTCSDCHDSHGEGPFRRHLVDDPDDPDGRLCARCHPNDLFAHIVVETGSTHAGPFTACVRCHMPKTAMNGAGRYGRLLALPTGQPSDANVVFFENDTTSHHFLFVPMKTHPDVAGVTPAATMPVPYTNSCGSACHDVAPLPFLTPEPVSFLTACPAGAAPEAADRRRPTASEEK